MTHVHIQARDLVRGDVIVVRNPGLSFEATVVDAEALLTNRIWVTYVDPAWRMIDGKSYGAFDRVRLIASSSWALDDAGEDPRCR